MEQGESIRARLPAALAALPNAGAFCTFGEEALDIPAIEVGGLGPVELPLLPMALGRIASVAERPDPKRPGTLRADRIHLEDPLWVKLLRKITRSAANRLGADVKVEARLQGAVLTAAGQGGGELPLGPPGPGRFATLLVALPSEHAGGELTVAHGGRIERVDLNGRAPDVVRWTAFFGEAAHRGEPLSMGGRFILVFALVAVEGAVPRIPDDSAAVDGIVGLLSEWERDRTALPRLLLPLCLHYSAFELSFARLGGPDRAAFSALQRAAARAGCVVYLGLLVLVEQGTWRGRAHDRRAQGPTRTVTDRRLDLVGLRKADEAPALPRLHFNLEEVAPPSELDPDEPDEDKVSSGNTDHGSYERTWRRPVFAIWPLSREDEAFIDSGVEGALGVLAAMTADPRQQVRAAELAAAMADVWPRGTSSAKVAGHLETMLEVVRRADKRVARRFLQLTVPDQLLAERHVPALLTCVGDLDDSDASEVLAAIARRARGPRAISALAATLEGCKGKRPAAVLGPAAEALVDRAVVMGGEDRPRWEETLSWAEVVGLVRILASAGRTEGGGRLAAWMLANPRQWPMETLIRYLLQPGSEDAALFSLTIPLRQQLRTELTMRVGPEPEAPRDLVRSTARLNCGCASCSALRSFLMSPTEKEWRVRGTNTELNHLVTVTRAAGTDVELTPIFEQGRRGLRFLKNDASFVRATAEWRGRSEALRLLGDVPSHPTENAE